MYKHVVSRHFHIQPLRHIRPLLTNDAVISVANSIVSSCLDYCYSLLCNASEHNLNKLQQYRILWHMLPASNAFSMQKSLHWPPVRQHAVLYKSTWKMENQDKTHYLVCAADQVQVVLV